MPKHNFKKIELEFEARKNITGFAILVLNIGQFANEKLTNSLLEDGLFAGKPNLSLPQNIRSINSHSSLYSDEILFRLISWYDCCCYKVCYLITINSSLSLYIDIYWFVICRSSKVVKIFVCFSSIFIFLKLIKDMICFFKEDYVFC